MGSSGSRIEIILRTAALFLTVTIAAWLIEHTQWDATIAVCLLAVIAQAALLMRLMTRSSHEMARVLEAIAFDDTSQTFSGLPLDDPNGKLAAAMTHVLSRLRAGRNDAHEALETVARRGDGLLHFVRNHRHLTKRLTTQIEIAPVRHIFARLQRLLANDLAARDIQMTTTVEPETLEIAVDTDLLDQALITSSGTQSKRYATRLPVS